MPTYQFRDTETGEEMELFMSFSERDEFLRVHDRVVQLPSAPAIISGVASGKNKPTDGFRDVLREIKKKNSRGLRRSTIETF